MSLTAQQKLALVEYAVRHSSTKAILEDDTTGLFTDATRDDVGEAFEEFADILVDKINMEATFEQEEIDAGGRSSERLEFLKDILITAVEGGCDYWAFNRGYDPDNGVVEFLEDEHDPRAADAPWQKVDVDMIARGLAKIKQPGFKINKQTLGWIMTGDVNNDAGDIDADAADCIVQAALFGELVYG